ncbi:MAG: suppressor of fused domain protein [Ferruginibacter sp.]
MTNKTIVNHLEFYLGKITRGFKNIESNDSYKLQVIEMRNGMFNGISAFSTLGMSNWDLNSKVSQKIIRQEILVLLPTNSGVQNTAAVLYDISKNILDSGFALLRGDVFDKFSGSIFQGYQFNSLYIASPVCLPDDFASFDTGNRRTVVFAWLIPVFNVERIFIHKYGWNAFEDKIESSNVDFFDLNRIPII